MIIDINPVAWSSSQFKIEGMLEAVLAFLNAFTMQQHENQLAVYASHLTGSCMLFPEQVSATATGIDRHKIMERVVTMVKELVAENKTDEKATSNSIDDPGSYLSAAMSMALCHINRVKISHPEIDSRVLVVQAAQDEPGQHMAIMNCVFTAERMATAIDAFVLSSVDSTFLQQAAHATDGIYYKPRAPPRSETSPVLLQYLLTIFLPGKACRKHLQLPHQESVDLRASCFFTHEMIDEGFVCSVCLSVFSEELPICRTCGTRFAFRKHPQLL